MSSALTLTLPVNDDGRLAVKKGQVLLAVVVRNGVLVAPDGWAQIVTALGTGTVRLDAYARLVDDGEAGSVVFTSATAQELQGALMVLRGSAPAVIVESSAHATVTADVTPDSPTISSLQAINIVLGVWSSSGVLELTPPDGFTLIDAFSTSIVSPRSAMFAYRIVGETGATIALPAAGSDGAATGRSFALVLRDGPPITPPVLFDAVPGNIGLLGKDSRLPRGSF